jgi:hypothetical protein
MDLYSALLTTRIKQDACAAETCGNDMLIAKLFIAATINAAIYVLVNRGLARKKPAGGKSV